MMNLSDMRTVGTAGNHVWKSTTASSEEGHPLHGGEQDSHGIGPAASKFHLPDTAFLPVFLPLIVVDANKLALFYELTK